MAKHKDHPPKLLDKMKEVVEKKKFEGTKMNATTKMIQFMASSKDRNVKIHKAGRFTTEANGQPYIKCSIGANQGSLYLLDDCFVFLDKPALIFMYDKVSEIVFERKSKTLTGPSGNFDFKIKMTDGKSQDFSLIEKKELKNLEKFFTAVSEQKFSKQKMRIANYQDDEDEEMGSGSESDQGVKNRMAAQGGSSSESEDDDFQGGAASSDGGDEDERRLLALPRYCGPQPRLLAVRH